MSRQQNRALIVVGSPRKGTSLVIAEHLAALLEERGMVVTQTHPEGVVSPRLLCAYRRARLVVLIFPLYVDGIPGSLLRVLENLAREAKPDPDMRLAAIVNAGFPEASQCFAALECARHFALAQGAIFAGGMAIGCGGAIGGRPLTSLGGMARNLVHALNITADALAAGRPLPPEAVKLAAKPMVPAFAYRILADHNFRKQARQSGANIHAKPYNWRRK